MRAEELFYIAIGILVGLGIAYFFLWGQPYSSLKEEYNQCQIDYQQLTESYNQLQKESGELLTKYQSCVGRETFFEWVDRLSSLGKLAKFIGLI